MSIKVMTYVWDGFPASGSELLIMLALADWCDDRGGSLFPSIKAVGEKARIGEKHARNIMHKFEAERYLAVVGNHFGGKPGTTREYRLNVAKLKQMADEANAKKEAEKAAKYGARKSAGDEWVDVFNTPPLQVTPNLEVTRTAPPQFQDGSTAVPLTPPLQVTLSTIDPPAEPSIKKEKSASAPAPHPSKSGMQIPDGMDPQIWADFLQLRRAKKAILTDTALKGIQREAAKAGVSLQTAIQACCEYGWQGFNAQWYAERQALATPAHKPAPAARPQAESFAERESRIKREKWEEMTGQKWPTEAAPARHQGYVVEAETRRIEK